MYKLIIIIFSSLSLFYSLLLGVTEIDELKEEGDINELDSYVLHNYPHGNITVLSSGYLLRAQTLENLPLDILIKKIRYEIKMLRTTIEKSEHYFALDETLRWQVWNLSESMEILQSMIGETIDPHLQFTRTIKQEAEKEVQRGLEAYQLLNKRIQAILTEERKCKETADFVRLATEGMIPYYAEQLERGLHLSAWNKTHDACGATGRAILYYFQEEAFSDPQYCREMKYPRNGLDNLLKLIEFNRGYGEGYLYFAESDRIDHVFVIYQAATGLYRIFQSYVNQYSLQASMAQQYLQSKGQPYLTYEQLTDQLIALEGLLNAQTLAPELEDLHRQLFHILPPKNIKKEFENMPSHLRFVSMQIQIE